jgi:hypothetical protein
MAARMRHAPATEQDLFVATLNQVRNGAQIKWSRRLQPLDHRSDRGAIGCLHADVRAGTGRRRQVAAAG